MDPTLKALCLEVLGGDVDGERFGLLLMETGVNIEGLEWDVATRLLERSDASYSITRRFGDTIH